VGHSLYVLCKRFPAGNCLRARVTIGARLLCCQCHRLALEQPRQLNHIVDVARYSTEPSHPIERTTEDRVQLAHCGRRAANGDIARNEGLEIVRPQF
jgi:hypothetical protein